MKVCNYFIAVFFIASIFFCPLDQKKEINLILINKLAFAHDITQTQNSTDFTKNNIKNIINSNLSISTTPLQKEKKIPNISFIDEANIKYFIKDFSGQVVVLYLWASWCLSCVENLVELNDFKKKLLYNDILDIELIPLTIDFKDRKRLEQLYKEKNIDKLGLFIDENKQIMKTFSINFVPAVIIIDKKLQKAERLNHNVKWNSDEVYNSLLKLR